MIRLRRRIGIGIRIRIRIRIRRRRLCFCLLPLGCPRLRGICHPCNDGEGGGEQKWGRRGEAERVKVLPGRTGRIPEQTKKQTTHM